MGQYFENEDLKSNIKEIKVKILDKEFYIYTDNGIFNKKGLDFGTRVLLEHIDFKNKNSALDLGCGSGSVGIFCLLNNINVDMVDVNKRAIKLTKMGLKKNKLKANVFISDIYSNINSKYDLIITNPPIHAGKNKIYEIIKEAPNHLTNNGELWIVIRKNHGAKSLIKDNNNIFNFDIIDKVNGFWIIKGNKK